jgi:hypothetical protein
MRGIMPFLALSIVAVYGLMVCTGLAGVAFGGYMLISSDYSWKSSRSNSTTNTYRPGTNTNVPGLSPNQFKQPTVNQPAFNPPAFNPPTTFVTPRANPFAPVEGMDVNSNSNQLMNQFRGRLVAKVSSEWAEWNANKAIDGNPSTSWFPQGSSTQQGAWYNLTFPQDVTIKRLTVLGNRDASWPGYGTRKMKVEFKDANGTVMKTHTGPPAKGSDFDFPNLNYQRVREIRITILEDIRGQTGFGQSTAIGEIQAE